MNEYRIDRAFKPDGKINVAILDTGIFKHVDFGDRIVAFEDFVNDRNVVYDDSGHGTHVAGIIAGSGAASCGENAGIAPDAGIIALKVLDKNGNGRISDVVRGCGWILEHSGRHNIRVVNISFGSVPATSDKFLQNGEPCRKTDYQEDDNRYRKLLTAVDSLWDAGIVVVTAAGNSGPKPGSITYPGVSRKVITVGAYDDVKFKSGRGPTRECVMKPEILVKGTNIVSCSNVQGRYATKSGTSMSAPIVSGGVIRLLERYPHMTPGEVKLKIRSCARNYPWLHERCAWGILDVKKLYES